MPDFAQRRTLGEYPLGAYRWTLLMLTVLAAVLAGYEFQLAPILPLLLPYLHMGISSTGTSSHSPSWSRQFRRSSVDRWRIVTGGW